MKRKEGVTRSRRGRPGWGGHFNHKDWKRNGRKMNVPQNESDLEMLENAARSGDGVAQHRLAMIQCDGDLADYPYGDKSFQAGLIWLKHSAEQGNVISQYQYGRLCFEWRGDDLFGDGLLAAIAYWERAYANGSNSNDPDEREAAAMAALELAELNHYAMLDFGEQFKPDPDKAAVWYERSARLSNADAADALSDAIYLENRDVFDWDAGEQHSEVLDKLFEYTKQAADQGYPYAKVRLAVLYAIGIGVAVDPDKALSLVRDTCSSYPHTVAEHCLKMIKERNMTIRDALYECRNYIG